MKFVPIDASKKEKDAAFAKGEAVEVRSIIFKFLADVSGAAVSPATDRGEIECVGHRGLVLAFHQKEPLFVVLSMTGGRGNADSPTCGNIQWGRLYMLREFDPSEHPFVVKHDLGGVPDEDGWTVVMDMRK